MQTWLPEHGISNVPSCHFEEMSVFKRIMQIYPTHTPEVLFTPIRLNEAVFDPPKLKPKPAVMVHLVV